MGPVNKARKRMYPVNKNEKLKIFKQKMNGYIFTKTNYVWWHKRIKMVFDGSGMGQQIINDFNDERW